MGKIEGVKLFRKINVRPGAVVQIITNNYCNLHCEWCSFLCNLPISKDSKIINRRKAWNISVEEVELYCKRFKGHYTDSVHKLLGGETTAMPPEKLYAIIDVFVAHKRKLKLLSNGFNIFGLDKAYLNKLDYIELNNHGINHAHIVNCFNYLKTFYKGELYRRTQDQHYDLGYAREHCIPGPPCNSIMSPPVLHQGVMYPCCVHPALELWNNNWEMRKTLKAAGWGLENPKVANVLANWRTNIPEYVLNQCSRNCWVQRRVKHRGPLKDITLKKNDIIKKGIK